MSIARAKQFRKFFDTFLASSEGQKMQADGAVALVLGGGTVTNHDATLKLTVTFVAPGQSGKDAAEAAAKSVYEANAWEHKSEVPFGIEITMPNIGLCRVVGFNTRARKMPFQLEHMDTGRRYKSQVQSVLKAAAKVTST